MEEVILENVNFIFKIVKLKFKVVVLEVKIVEVKEEMRKFIIKFKFYEKVDLVVCKRCFFDKNKENEFEGLCKI